MADYNKVLQFKNDQDYFLPYKGPEFRNQPSDIVHVEPHKRMQAYAHEYVGEWMKSSREFVYEKERHFLKLQNIYENRLKLSEWTDNTRVRPDETAATKSKALNQNWRADLVLCPSYIVNAFADRGYQAIFANRRYFHVSPDEASGEIASWMYQVAPKVEAKLLKSLAQGRFDASVYHALQTAGMVGTAIAKTFWDFKEVPRFGWQLNPFTQQYEVAEQQQRVFNCPAVKTIPITHVLPDWTATDYDVQRWTGCGHFVDLPYSKALEQFEAGILHLNRGEFEKKFSSRLGSSQPWGGDDLYGDPDKDYVRDKIPRVTLWEWHGELATDKGPLEACATIATDPYEHDSPTEGLLVRLRLSPVLWSGLRPFVAAHYTPFGRPFGPGALDDSLDLIYYTSQLLNQIIDNGRLTTNAIVRVNQGGALKRKMDKETGKNQFYPGAVWPVDGEFDGQLVDFSAFNGQVAAQLVANLNTILEKRSFVTEQTLGGVTKSHVSATSAQEAATRSDIPFNVRISLFARSFLEPAGQLCLGMLQQFAAEDDYVMIPDAMGQMQPILLTAAELIQGRYKCHADIIARDQSRDIKAQSIERVLPVLLNPQNLMTLGQTGYIAQPGEILKKWLQYLGIEDAERLVMAVQQAQSLGMGPQGMAPQLGPAGPGMQGGPMGAQPTDMNAAMQQTQENARQRIQGR